MGAPFLSTNGVAVRAELRAIHTEDFNPGTLFYSVLDGALYTLDKNPLSPNAALPDNGFTVLRPTVGPGVFVQVSPGSANMFFLPAGDNQAATINAALAAGIGVLLGPGEHSLEAPITAPVTGGLLTGMDGAIITPNYSPPVGQADTPTNALVLGQGTVGSAVNTTIAGGQILMTDTDSVRLTSNAGVVADMWLRFEGGYLASYPNDEANASAGASVIATEILQVQTVAADLTLHRTARQFHRAGTAVNDVTPIQNLTIKNIEFDARGGTIANGILLDYARNVQIIDCKFSGFSRTGVEVRLGSQDVTIRNISSPFGEVNSLVLGTSPMDVTVDGVERTRVGPRTHANGIPRGQVQFQWRHTNVRVANVRVANGRVGMRMVGGRNWQVENAIITDMDGRTGVFGVDPLVGTLFGTGFDSGYAVAASNETAIGAAIGTLQIRNCWSSTNYPNVGGSCSVYLNGLQYMHVGLIQCVNQGPVQGTVINGRSYFMAGVVAQNSLGLQVDCIECTGLNYGLVFLGQLAGLSSIGSYTWNEPAGNGGSSNNALLIDTDANGVLTVGNATPRIAKMAASITSATTLVAFGSTYSSQPDLAFRIDEFFLANLGKFCDVIPVFNNSGAGRNPGELVYLDAASPAGARRVITPTASGQRVMAMIQTTSAGAYGMAAPLPSRYAVLRCDVAVAVGDFLVWTAANQPAVNNAADPDLVIGVALNNKGAGVGFIPVGPR